MIVVYIAGPYRDPRGEYHVERNIRAAESAALRVWGWGGVALCPHKNTSHFGGALPDSVWLTGDLELLKRCDAMWAIDGWDRSSGTCQEVLFARENGIPVFHGGSETRKFIEAQAQKG